MSPRITRRKLLLGLPGCALASEIVRGHTVPAEAYRFADAATELDVVRLTDPEHTARMTASWLKSISHNGSFLLYSSDRSGSMQAWRMDLKTGESRLLTEAASLDASSLALSGDERSFCYWDGGVLNRCTLASAHSVPLYHLPGTAERGQGFSLSSDGMYAAFAIQNGTDSRLQLIDLVHRTVTPIGTAKPDIADPQIRPRRAQILYRRAGTLRLVDFTGQNDRPMKTVEGGEIGPVRWSPNGRSLFYLHFPGEHQLNTIRELTPDGNTDKLIAKTSQFVQFGINGDGSVFVGASRNTGSPYVLLLLKVTQRELTLCEHHSSDPAAVSPVFSPDSQRIFFLSDRDGKPAIYRIKVEKFVEETEG